MATINGKVFFYTLSLSSFFSEVGSKHRARVISSDHKIAHRYLLVFILLFLIIMIVGINCNNNNSNNNN